VEREAWSVDQADLEAPLGIAHPADQREARSSLRSARFTGVLQPLRELLHYRALIQNLIVRDLKVRYKNSLLGVAWSLLNPLLMMVVFTVVFTVLAGDPGIYAYPAYILSALLPWQFFAASVIGGTNSFVGNAHIIKKVYFPREALPVSLVLANLVNFLLALPVYFLLARAMDVPVIGGAVSPWLALLPVVLAVQVIFTVGIVLILATVNVFYRDTALILEVVMLAWFFLTPIIWDVSRLPETSTILGLEIPIARWVYYLNPMASIVATYRDILYWGWRPALDFFARTAITVLVVLALGYALFRRYSKTFGEEL
jgi:ABC-type polysaccharide/polyol phosphate export permease